MTDITIRNINEFYEFIDANVFRAIEAINLKVNLNLLNELEQKIAKLIIDCLNYTIHFSKLTPLLIYKDGASYPDIQALSDIETNYLYYYASHSKNKFIISHINHFLFLKTKSQNKFKFA